MSRSWQDSSRPRDERLSDLLAEMTLEEKVAQLGSAFTGFTSEANLATDQQQVAPFQDAFEETRWDKSILIQYPNEQQVSVPVCFGLPRL